MITRQQYMADYSLHEQYYLELANDAGIGNFDDKFLAKVRKCLGCGDEHLNNIALQRWDDMCRMDRLNHNLCKALAERGDQLSLSTGVCIRKAKARYEANQLIHTL